MIAIDKLKKYFDISKFTIRIIYYYIKCIVYSFPLKNISYAYSKKLDPLTIMVYTICMNSTKKKKFLAFWLLLFLLVQCLCHAVCTKAFVFAFGFKNNN